MIGFPYCGRCRACRRGEPHYCDHAQELLFSGYRLDGTGGMTRKDGRPLAASSFSSLPERRTRSRSNSSSRECPMGSISRWQPRLAAASQQAQAPSSTTSSRSRAARSQADAVGAMSGTTSIELHIGADRRSGYIGPLAVFPAHCVSSIA